jgi:hypothetical protein
MADIDGIKAEMRRLFIAGTKATMNHRNASGSNRDPRSVPLSR